MVCELSEWVQFPREFCLHVSPRDMGILDDPAWQKEPEWCDREELVAIVHGWPTTHWKHNLGEWKIPVLGVGPQQMRWRCLPHIRVGSQRRQQRKIGGQLFDQRSLHRFCKDTNHTQSSRTITDAPSLLTTINSFDHISPPQMEDSIIFSWSHGSTKHSLSIVLVEL